MNEYGTSQILMIQRTRLMIKKTGLIEKAGQNVGMKSETKSPRLFWGTAGNN